VGRHGKLFRIHKFRTMTVDAEQRGPQLTVGADARVTRVGRAATCGDEKKPGIKKWGARRAPRRSKRKTTASSRPFSFRPWLPSSPFFSPQVVVTQPPTNHLVVTTGGLSHPPSYQM